MALKKKIRKPINDIDRDLHAELEAAMAVAKPLPASVGLAIQAAARRTVTILKRRGGARPGAGRKPLGKTRLQTQVKPETLLALRRAARGKRGLGSVIDRLVAERVLGK